MRKLTEPRGYLLVDTLVGILLLASVGTVIAAYGVTLFKFGEQARTVGQAQQVVTTVMGIAADTAQTPRSPEALAVAATAFPGTTLTWGPDVGDTGLVSIEVTDGTILCIQLPPTALQNAAYVEGECSS